MTQPSRVVHLRALPDATQEADISSFCSAWGAVDTVVLMHSSHQALVQMAQLGCAAAMVTQCAGSAATLRLASGEMAPVQVQFSRHAELNRQGSGGGGGGGAGGDGAVPNRILLITMRNHTQQYSAITLDYLHQMLSQFGPVERIVTTQKPGPPLTLQVLCQFGDASHATNARQQLTVTTPSTPQLPAQGPQPSSA